MSRLIQAVAVQFLIIFAITQGTQAQIKTQGLVVGDLSQVETLLISDVDDTLKVAHVLNKLDLIQNGMRTDNPFLGMSSLYQMRLKNEPGLVIAYVSNAYEIIMDGKHNELLKKAKFPAGEVLLRKNPTDNEHKNNAIRALVAKYNPKKMVLIGDNAEGDPEIYAKASEEFKRLDIEVYIHQIYSTKSSKEKGTELHPGQIGYVTAVDLAMMWFGQNFIRQSDMQNWVSQIVPLVLKEKENLSSGALAFPSWMNCKDFTPPANELLNNDLLSQYVEKRNRRCSTR